MPIYKRCSCCGRRLAPTEQCTCIRRRHNKEYDKYSRDRRSKAFYHSAEWTRTRQAALDLDGGIDVYLYMTTGEVVAADTVHHIRPLRTHWEKRLSLDNLMSLSSDTHSRIEKQYETDEAGMIKRLSAMLRAYRDPQGAG
ncbi:MAG: HNH endonuclease [Lachnospiraceae bacterium]|nr:HNH endonuclease [Lachnospiraceae bacterium]